MILHHARAALGEVLRGLQTREVPELANEVRLIGEPALDHQLRPVRRRGLAEGQQGLLETPEAAEQFRRQPDFPREHLDEASWAEANLLCDIADPDTRIGLH